MTGRSLAQGLMASSGEQLRLIYVLVMETGIFSMITNKTKDLLDKGVDHSQQQLNSEIAKLNNVDDDVLRLELFLHMTKEFELAGSHYNTSNEIEYKCGDILHKAHAYQVKKDKDYSSFVSRNKHLSVDSQLALFQMQKIFESIGGELNKLTADQQENFADQIEKFIESLPIEQQQKIKEKLNIDTVTNSTIKKVVATQGSAVLLAVIVEIAGFAAYTTLTSLMAGTASLLGLTLPFGAYITATSFLSVLTGPVGLILIGGASGIMMLAQSKKVKKTLLQMGIVQLMLPVLLDESKVYQYDSLIQQWTYHYNKQSILLDSISNYTNEHSSIFQALKTTEEKIEEINKELNDIIIAFNKIVNYIANSLTLVSQHEMTNSFISKNLKIENLEGQVRDGRDLIKKNKQLNSFFDKVGGMLLNISLDSNINKIQKQIQELKKEQAIEIISVRPLNLRKECNDALALLEEKELALGKIKELNVQKRNIETKLSKINKMLIQKKVELSNLQKEIHGLGDLV